MKNEEKKLEQQLEQIELSKWVFKALATFVDMFIVMISWNSFLTRVADVPKITFVTSLAFILIFHFLFKRNSMRNIAGLGMSKSEYSDYSYTMAVRHYMSSMAIFVAIIVLALFK